MKLWEDKSKLTGQPAQKFANGQQWLVEDLVRFSGMTAKERYEWGKLQAFPDVATDAELLEALA